MAVKYIGGEKFDKTTGIKTMQQRFGSRPGNYKVDSYYFKTGMGNKPYWWNDYERKWEMLKYGDEFDLDEQGICVRVNR